MKIEFNAEVSVNMHQDDHLETTQLLLENVYYDIFRSSHAGLAWNTQTRLCIAYDANKASQVTTTALENQNVTAFNRCIKTEEEPDKVGFRSAYYGELPSPRLERCNFRTLNISFCCVIRAILPTPWTFLAKQIESSCPLK